MKGKHLQVFYGEYNADERPASSNPPWGVYCKAMAEAGLLTAPMVSVKQTKARLFKCFMVSVRKTEAHLLTCFMLSGRQTEARLLVLTYFKVSARQT